MKHWACPRCQSEQTHDTHCQACDQPRFQWFEEQICRHILEHIEDGISEPLEMFTALKDRPCYASWPGSVVQVARYMRLLTKDTRDLAIRLVRAKSAPTMLEVLAKGTPADKINVMKHWGPDTNAERVEHKGELITKHVVELHEGPPPKQGS